MFKSFKTTLVFFVIFGLFIPGYVSADAKKASRLRAKATVMAIIAGTCFWFAPKAAYLASAAGSDSDIFGKPDIKAAIGFGALTCALLGGGIAASWYTHKLRMARKKELQNS